MGSQCSVLSSVAVTSARLWAGRLVDPTKMRSSLLRARKASMLCSPSTQRSASATFDLPLPLGPMMAVMLPSKLNSVFVAKVLKPCKVRRFRRILPRSGDELHPLYHSCRDMYSGTVNGFCHGLHGVMPV